jgi:hypothetical protein
MANVFAQKANEASGSTSKSKTQKVTVVVNTKEFDAALKEYARLDAEMKSLKTQMDVIGGELRPACINIFTEEYQKKGSYPESFNIQSVSGASVLFVPSDKYKKIETPEAFDEMMKVWGENVVEKAITYTLDEDLVNEYGEKISNALTKALGKELVDRLIKVEAINRVKKGSIEKAFTFGKGKIKDFITAIAPVFSLKNAKLG